MTRKVQLFKVTFATVLFAALLAGATSVFAGGFQLAVEAPEAGKTSLKDAALIVRTFGCMQPADANVTVTAEGIVNGHRQTLPVEMRGDEKGVYSIRQQWPAEGKWVLVMTGALHGMTSTVFVELGEKGKVYADTRLAAGQLEGTHARGLRRKPTTGDVEAALKANIGSIAMSEATAPVVPTTAIAAGGGSFLFLLGLAALKRRRAHN
ncbi:MAG TPA: hypothetical protein VKA60_02675 [Blastocatellia bacterium]|nr:hypothetical protein [Blastocatellia bacterium]